MDHSLGQMIWQVNTFQCPCCISLPEHFGSRNFCSKTFCSHLPYETQNKLQVTAMSGTKNVGTEKVWNQNVLGTKILGPKYYGTELIRQKYLVPKDIRLKRE